MSSTSDSYFHFFVIIMNFNFQTLGKVLYGVAGVVMFSGFFLTAGNVLGNNDALEKMCLVNVQTQQLFHNRCK